MLQDTCITICDKPYFFKRCKNKASIDNRKQVQKEKKLIFDLGNKANQLDKKEEDLKTRITVQTKRLDSAKKDKDKLKILDSIDGLMDELDNCVEERNKLEQEVKDNNLEDFDPDELELEMHANILDMKLANFDKEDFIENSTLYDLIVAKNIDVFYALAMAGKSSDEIAAKIDEVVEEDLLGSISK